jgi:hypothetical protein
VTPEELAPLMFAAADKPLGRYGWAGRGTWERAGADVREAWLAAASAAIEALAAAPGSGQATAAHDPRSCPGCQRMVKNGGHRIIDLLGHAGYEAFRQHATSPPWADVREAWAQAANAITAEWSDQDDDLRALVAEILDELDLWELLVEDDKREEWRARAGLGGTGRDGARWQDGEYPPVPVPAAAWVTYDELAAAIGRCMPRIRSDIERADGWIAAHVEDPRDYAWSLLQQCAGWDPDAEPPPAGPGGDR